MTLESVTVTPEDVATTEPVVLTVLSSKIIVSLPSVVRSLTNVLLIDPVLSLIVIEPEFLLSVKSVMPVVPLLVQYNVDPSDTFVVVTVNTTVSPSFITCELGLMLYVDGGDILVSLTNTDGETPRLSLLAVFNSMIIVFCPSVVRSFFNALVIVPTLLLIVTVPKFVLSIKSLAMLVPIFVQYNMPPFGIP